jgi:hypothetical protein
MNDEGIRASAWAASTQAQGECVARADEGQGADHQELAAIKEENARLKADVAGLMETDRIS